MYLERSQTFSNIQLKTKKTVIVPFWDCELEEVVALVQSIVPEWKAVRVAYCAKYLLVGMLLGPRSSDALWSSALEKHTARVENARATKAGLLMAVLGYNIMCITTLSYIWQFCVASHTVLATEYRMLQKLVGSPRYTFSKEALWSLDALGM